MAVRVCPKCQQVVDSEEPYCPRDGTRLLKRSVFDEIVQQTDPLVGKRIAGRYLVIKKLGEGGMGDVFLAEHEDIEKRLAIKVLKQEYSSRVDMVVRFKQEAVSASRIKHPNVVDVFDFGQMEDSRFFLVMELLEGRDLADVLSKEGVIEPRRAVSLALQICRALAAAHAKGVIHRDMKPENVFLTSTMQGEEVVKIVDFGIAKMREVGDDGSESARRKITKTGMIFGTPEYMAPEQAAGKPVDDKADVYATGIMMFEMLAGRVPFFGSTFMAVLTAHLTAEPPRMQDVSPRAMQLSAELEDAVMKALCKAPADRHASMMAFADALARTPEAGADIPIPLARMVPSKARNEVAKRPQQSQDVEGQATPEPQVSSGKSRRTGLIVATAVGIGAIGIAVAAIGMRGAGEPKGQVASSSATVIETRNEPATPPASAVASTAPAASSAPLAVVRAPDGSVRLHVETKPAGAVVKKRDGDSWFQVCAATPCDYPARLDEKVELMAELGALRGQASVLARTAQTVTITLASSSRTVPGGGKRTDQCEFCVPKGDPDCIKVLRPCGSPP